MWQNKSVLHCLKIKIMSVPLELLMLFLLHYENQMYQSQPTLQEAQARKYLLSHDGGRDVYNMAALMQARYGIILRRQKMHVGIGTFKFT